MSAGHEVQVEKCASVVAHTGCWGRRGEKEGPGRLQEVTLHTSGADEQYSSPTFKLLNPEHPLETQNRMKAQVGKYTYLDLM